MHYTIDLIIAVPFALFCWWLAAGCRPRRGAGLFVLSLLGALGGLVLWAIFAPIPSPMAWTLTLLCLLAPCWAALRLHCSFPLSDR